MSKKFWSGIITGFKRISDCKYVSICACVQIYTPALLKLIYCCPCVPNDATSGDTWESTAIAIMFASEKRNKILGAIIFRAYKYTFQR